MPRLGEQSSDDRIAVTLELIADKLDDLMGRDSVVNVKAPDVRVPPGPAPVVNVEVPPLPRSKSWIFTVHRDGQGFIETITATPKY